MRATTEIERIDTIYRLLKVKGVGPVLTNKILFSVSSNFDVDGFQDKINSVLDSSQRDCFNRVISVVKELTSQYTVGFMSILDDGYPEELKRFLSVNTPPVLSYIGNIGLLSKRKIAFSGSRKVSPKGIGITRDCVNQLSNDDVCIVSGYAAGVDLSAHEEAITSGASTIIVMPEGINNFRIKKELRAVWDWSRILVISEFMPSDNWTASRAMARNNTILGLSDVVFVIEAGDTGGSLDAGIKALSGGKPLFVPQYGIVPESAVGNNTLIARGAFPIRMKKDTSRANLDKVFELLQVQVNDSLF